MNYKRNPIVLFYAGTRNFLKTGPRRKEKIKV
jgi:hypothetical protein